MKEVLITGGAGGIGKEIVEAMVKRDFFVHIIDIDVAACEAIQAQYGKESIAFYPIDVTDGAALSAKARELAPSMSLDHIITLAGRALPGEWGAFSKTSMETIGSSVQLNLVAHLQTVHAFLPLMKSDGDRSITFISSINAISNYGLPIYAAAKAGLTGFVNASVTEFGAKGIRINAVLPGTVITAATQQEPKDFDRLLKTTAINRFVTAEDVGSFVSSLACDWTSLTGQSLVLDAGQSRTNWIKE